MMHKESVLVNEIFYSLQGEGHHSGKACFFIRFAGCDIDCQWCDTKYASSSLRSFLIHIDKIICKLRSLPVKIVVITGGEPLIHDLDFLTKKLKEEKMEIHLETSGAYSFRGCFDWVCLSPKQVVRPIEEAYQKANELKVVISEDKDFYFAEREALKVGKNTFLYLQPEWGKIDIFVPKIVEYIKKNPKWNLSLQTHKYIDIK